MITFTYIKEIAKILKGLDWIVVGGMMTHSHCWIAKVDYDRSTSDVDIVVSSGKEDLVEIKERLLSSGFSEHLSLHSNILYRFDHKDGWHVDVMTRDRQSYPLTWSGKTTIACPGSDSALGIYNSGEDKETLEIALQDNLTYRIPNVWSAIAMKGRAYRTTGENTIRHMQDSLALFACSTEYNKRELTKSEREAVNFILSSSSLSSLEAWEPLHDDIIEEKAIRGILSVRTDNDVKFPEPLIPLVNKLRSEYI